MNSREPQFPWEDVTDVWHLASKALNVGETLESDEFILSDVMTAVEVGDKNMDPGCGYQDACTLDEYIECTDLPSNPPVATALGTMDHLLCNLAAWLRGASLPPTVYTCVYVHRPTLLDDCPLKTYLLGVLKVIQIISAVVIRADVRDDEEFSPMLWNVDLGNDSTVNEVVTALHAASESLPDGDPIIARLRFVEYLLMSVEVLEAGPAQKVPEALGCLKRALGEWQHITDHRTSLVDEAGCILDIPPVEGIFTRHAMQWSGCPPPLRPPPAAVSFTELDTTIRSYLSQLSTLCELPGSVTLPSILDFFEHFATLEASVPARSLLWLLAYDPHEYRMMSTRQLKDLVLQSLTDDYGAPLYANIMAAAAQTGGTSAGKKKAKKKGKQQQDPGLVVEGTAATAVATHGAAGEPMTTPHGEEDPWCESNRHHKVATWLEEASATLWRYLHARCFNRPRQRRKLSRLFAELGGWQGLSQEVDSLSFHASAATHEQLRSFVLTAYTYDFVLHVMVEYMQMGFDLELYHPTEYHMMFWYIDYTLSQRVENFATLYHTEDPNKASTKTQGSGGGGAGRGDTRHRLQQQLALKQQQQQPPPEAYSSREVKLPAGPDWSLIELTNCVARGLHRFLATLEKDGVLTRTPEHLLSTVALRHGHRIAPFLQLSHPSAVHHSLYVQYTDTSKRASSEILGTAVMEMKERTKASKEVLAACTPVQRDTIQRLLRVAQGNLVSMKVYGDGYFKGSPLVIEYDFGVHPSFPVIKLKKVPPQVTAS